MSEYFNLKGQVALVTGCSGGLGVQMARALASVGCNIVPIARRLEKLEEVAAALMNEGGRCVLNEGEQLLCFAGRPLCFKLTDSRQFDIIISNIVM